MSMNNSWSVGELQSRKGFQVDRLFGEAMSVCVHFMLPSMDRGKIVTVKGLCNCDDHKVLL